MAGGQSRCGAYRLAALSACRAVAAAQHAGGQGPQPRRFGVDVRALRGRAPTVDRRRADDAAGENRPLPAVSALGSWPATVVGIPSHPLSKEISMTDEHVTAPTGLPACLRRLHWLTLLAGVAVFLATPGDPALLHLAQIRHGPLSANRGRFSPILGCLRR